MKMLAKDTWHALCQNWKNLLLFELLYRGIMLPVYLQLTNRMLQTALQMAGYSYLTAENIGAFLLRPVTLLIALLVVIVGMLLQVLEIAGLITAFQGAAYSHKLSPLHILWGGIQKLNDEVARKNIHLGLLTPLYSFLVNIVCTGYMLSHMRPVSIWLQEYMEQPFAWLLPLVILLVCLQISVPLMFSFHACMIEKRSFRDAVTRSRELLHKHRGKAVGHLLGCHVVVVGLILFLYGIHMAVMMVGTVLTVEGDLVQAAILSKVRNLDILWLLVGSTLISIVHYGALTVLFYQYANRRYHEPEWKLVYPAKGTPERCRLAGFLLIVTISGIIMMLDYDKHGRAFSEDMPGDVQIVAHRGNIRTAPENTMAAMRIAAAEMADCIEVDVQMTKDGIVVLGNDANLRRVAGVNRSIRSLTYEELQKLDVGSWFLPKYGGERIPTLGAVLKFCKENDMNLQIEIKRTGHDQELPVHVAELIREFEMEPYCMITSTSLSHLMRIKELEPKLRTGYIVSAAYGDVVPGQQVDFISIRHSFATKELVESIHEQGKQVYAWTVNIPAEMERLQKIGVDGIMTDRPVTARETIYGNEQLECLTDRLRMIFR